MNKDQSFLGTEPVGKLLMRLAVPTVIAQLVNMLYNIVDRIYIGHMPGDGSLGADRRRRLHADDHDRHRPLPRWSASGGAPRASIFMGRGRSGDAPRGRWATASRCRSSSPLC